MSDAASCLTYDDGADRPETPPEQRKFRRLRQNEVGRRFIHPGLADIPVDQNKRYGKVEPRGADVQAVMSANADESEWLTEQKEAVYKSRKRSPLGKTKLSGAELPDKVKDESFRFGATTAYLENDSATDLVTPVDGSTKEWKSIKEQNIQRDEIIAKHSATDRLMKHPYEPSPEQHAAWLARKKAKEADLVDQDGLHHSVASSIAAQSYVTRIVPLQRKDKSKNKNNSKTNSDANENDNVQQHSPQQQQQQQQPKQQQKQADGYDAAQCIQGSGWGAAEDEHGSHESYRDRLKKRHALPEHIANQSFGAQPKQHDDSSGDLLFPSAHAATGVSSKDFAATRGASEIREIFAAAGYDMSDEDFGRAVAAATRNGRRELSVDNFRTAYNKLFLGIKP
eukprot:TRINITY_DN66631_c7_g7_i1.p1 TRINITY_DN66631_c7_g7~~TRINITY_DN66631_c7_g7_i1.p1  ORF type:complete len:396 (+),score=217.48 TRINITY_DN66631_c7_g7_i1:105-1292(+)